MIAETLRCVGLGLLMIGVPGAILIVLYFGAIRDAFAEDAFWAAAWAVFALFVSYYLGYLVRHGFGDPDIVYLSRK